MFYQFYLENVNEAYTPVVDDNSLDKYYEDLQRVLYVEYIPVEDVKFFQQAIGCLLYLTDTICFDVSYIINRLA